jgi:hypothetical protein
MNKTISNSIKSILPPKYINTLMERTGMSKGTVIKVVEEENMEHEIWPKVLDLAEEWKQEMLNRETRKKELIGQTQGAKAAAKQKLG